MFDKRVKAIVVKKGLLPESKAEETFQQASQEDKSYEDVLLDRGLVDEKLLIATIAAEMNIPPIDVERVEPEERAIRSLSQDLASYYCVLPIARIGNILTLATANPFDIIKLDEIRTVTECDIRAVVSTERSIRKSITRAYNPGEEEMKGLIDNLADPEVELKEEGEEEKVDLAEISDAAGDSPVIKLVNLIISQAVRDGASDIHIEPFEKRIRIRFRQDGALREWNAPPKKMHNALVSRIKIMAQLDIAERRIPQDGKIQLKLEGRSIDFRVSVLPTVHGEKVVIRILDSTGLARSLEDMGFEQQALEAFKRAITASYGMVLVTGPTGSGKSTTLYSAVREVITPEENVVTVEDPVEYQLDGVIQVPVNVKKGLTFAAALRSILRQDPDTVMIGEIRDQETADIAVKAAITGHLVFSTLHTNDASSAVSRLVDMGIDPFMVASSVILIGAQRLLRKLCDNCKQPILEMPPDDRLLRVGFTPEEVEAIRKNIGLFVANGGTIPKDAPGPFLMKSVGCPRCMNGYKGRFAILEALEFDEQIRKMIVNGASAIELKEYAVKKRGMLTLRRCGIVNVLKGRTSIEEVLNITMSD